MFARLLFCWVICISALSAGNLPQGLGVPVLLFNRVVEEKADDDFYVTTKEALKQQLGALKLAGYQTITPEELKWYFEKKQPIPKNSIMLTFDDAKKETYKNVDPLLQEMGYSAVLFIASLLQEEGVATFLSWKDLSKMHESKRWSIQAGGYKYHTLIPIDDEGTLGSFGSNRMWLGKEGRLETVAEFKKRLRADLIEQKEQIEKHIKGVKVIAFAYPYAEWGEASKNLDPALATAINFAEVDLLFPLSFAKVVYPPGPYEPTSTPHMIARLMSTPHLKGVELLKILTGEPF